MVKGKWIRLGMGFALMAVFCFFLYRPGGAALQERVMGDLDGNGIKEEYHLDGGRLQVSAGTELLWRSPGDWQVDSFVLGDADNDGTPNLCFSLWKAGSYGSRKPFWQNGADTSYKNHFFVYKLQGKTMKQVWCSSNLDRPILSFDIRDVNSDGLNELVVEEGRYHKETGERYTIELASDRRITIWRWDEWGFSLLK